MFWFLDATVINHTKIKVSKETSHFYGTFTQCEMQKIIYLSPSMEKSNESISKDSIKPNSVASE